MMSKLLSLLVPIITIPLTLSYLGKERYGIWMTLSSITATLAFADLGIGLGLLNMISECNGKEDLEQARIFVSSAFFMLLSIASVLAMVYWVAAPHLAWSYLFKASSRQTLSDVPGAMAIFLICFLLNMPLGVIDRVYLGYQEAYASSISQLAGSVLYLLSVGLIVRANLGLHGLVLASSGLPILVLFINGYRLFRLRRPWLLPRVSLVRHTAVLRLLKVGSMFFILQICVAIGYSSDNLVIAGIKGPSVVADYAVTARLFGIISGLVAMALNPLWPAFTEAASRNDVLWVKSTLRRTVGLVFSITACGAICLLLSTNVILRYWTKNQLHASTLVIVTLALWSVLAGFANVVSIFLNAMNVFLFPVVGAVLASVLNLCTSIWLTRRFGPAGVAMGSTIAMVIYLIPLWLIAVPQVFTTLSERANTDRVVLGTSGKVYSAKENERLRSW